jgi:hypothetical protein
MQAEEQVTMELCYDCINIPIKQCSATFLSAAHPTLSNVHDGTLQTFTSRKGVTKLYISINMYLHVNPCPIRMQVYENKT